MWMVSFLTVQFSSSFDESGEMSKVVEMKEPGENSTFEMADWFGEFTSLPKNTSIS